MKDTYLICYNCKTKLGYNEYDDYDGQYWFDYELCFSNKYYLKFKYCNKCYYIYTDLIISGNNLRAEELIKKWYANLPSFEFKIEDKYDCFCCKTQQTFWHGYYSMIKLLIDQQVKICEKCANVNIFEKAIALAKKYNNI